MSEEYEEYPVHKSIRVLKGETVYKTSKWWQACILSESFGRKTVAIYLWQRKDGGWRRVHKLTIGNRQTWNRIKQIVDKLILELRG